MDFSDKDLRRLYVLIIVLSLTVLVFLVVKPILLSIIGGLILAYAFFPVYILLLKKTKSRNLSASLVSVLLILLIIVPLYFLIPLIIEQVFAAFQSIQKIDITAVIRIFIPSAPESFITKTTLLVNDAVNKATSSILNALVGILLETPTILFNLAIVAFVFFFALRDSEEFGKFVSALSPLNKLQEAKIVQQFKDITNAVVYGQIAIGMVQGVTAGLGFFLFGIPNALVLTILAVFFSIIPVLGPFVIWAPVFVYLMIGGNTTIAIFFLIYCILIVSNVDNLLRLYLLSKKGNLSQVISLIGLIGGLYLFGILGILIGPLLLAYFITFLNAYRENTFSSMFKSDT